MCIQHTFLDLQGRKMKSVHVTPLDLRGGMGWLGEGWPKKRP